MSAFTAGKSLAVPVSVAPDILCPLRIFVILPGMTVTFRGLTTASELAGEHLSTAGTTVCPDEQNNKNHANNDGNNRIISNTHQFSSKKDKSVSA